MDIAEVLGGILFLTVGFLLVVPIPLDGWFYGSTLGASVIGSVGGIFFIVLGFYLIVAGFRSEKKSQTREVVEVMCLILAFLFSFAGLIAESETWARVFLILGVGSLVVGIGLVGIRKIAKKATRES